MISFFKINDPIRLVAVLLLLFLLRLPVFISGYDLLQSEFSWMIIGESLNDGFVMYKDIQSNLGYLSAWVYKMIDLLFGRSQLAYQLIATVLIAIQAVSINLYYNSNDVLKEKGFVPAFFYVVLSFAFLDFYTLSPVLMSLTFLIPALGELLNLMKNGSTENGILKVGVHTGLASLFYLPSVTLLLMFFIVFLLFTKANFKNYLLFFMAYFFPALLLGLSYLWSGSFDKYFYDIFYYSLGLNKVKYMSMFEIVIAMSPSIFLTALAVAKVLTSSGFVNFQQRCHALMSLWFVGTGLSLLLSSHLSVYNVILTLPPTVYFLSNFYFVTDRKILKILYFNVMLVGLFAFSYMGVLFEMPKKLQDVRMFVGQSPLENKGVKVLVLGDDLSHYKGNYVATSLVNWHLDNRIFDDFSLYKNIIALNDRIDQDPPEVIVDQYNKIPTIIKRIPAIGMAYKKGDGNFYYKVSN